MLKGLSKYPNELEKRKWSKLCINIITSSDIHLADELISIKAPFCFLGDELRESWEKWASHRNIKF